MKYNNDNNRDPAAVYQLSCHRCGHRWFPRSPVTPKWCPKCNSPYWSKPRKAK
ncbi:MAG: hypothetical protein PHQ86_01915 [Dehalococcoidales bacterium]|nr:hypothetical protein [Dehalococcoidales bacterium]